MSKKFTELFPEDLTYDKKSRIQKAKKIQSILRSYFGSTNKKVCLDLGCSKGIITQFLGQYYKEVIGVDVDTKAVNEAIRNNKVKNVKFEFSKENQIPIADKSLDVVIFNQIYEHVDNPEKIFSEINRVLKNKGVCFFGARNRLGIFDGHYNLPFIAWLPKKMADYYISITSGKKKYDINLYSYWQLRKLIRGFELKDYTLRVIDNPKKFEALDVVPTFLHINKFIYLLFNIFYFLVPNYLWVLEKK